MITYPTKGHLLVSEPSILGDTSFTRSVILLAEHNDEGSVGFILNKPHDVSLSDLIEGIEDCEMPIYNGGPVEQENLYFIHTAPDLIEGSLEISSGIYWGGNFERALDLIMNKEICCEKIKFFLGYSGWESNQLNQEIIQNSWVILENDQQDELLKDNHTALWRDKLIEIGGDYALWSNAPENPQYN